MLLLLAAPALAGILDAALFGGAVGVHATGDVAAGPTLVSVPGGLDIAVLFGPETEALPVVRRWTVNVGGWVPDHLTSRKTRKAEAASARNRRPGEQPPPLLPESLVLWSPRITLGGNAWENERIHAIVGGDGLVNLLQPTGVRSADGYAGITFGGVSRVRYLEGVNAGEGALLVHGGLGGGGRAGDSLVVRGVAEAQVEPLALDVRLRGEVLVGLSLLPSDAPVALQLRARGELAPMADWAATGEAVLAIGLAVD
jgi:hypothetical protein